MIHHKWDNSDIAGWAHAYTCTSSETLLTLENSLGVSHSTLWWCFQHRLAAIDEALYMAAMNKMVFNKYHKCKKKQV